MVSEQIFCKALAKHNAHKYEEAIKLYKMVLMKSPLHLDANYLLGTIYAEIGRYEDSKKYLLKAEEIMPRSPFIKLNLGIVHKEQGENEIALKFFIQALELQPDLPEAKRNFVGCLNLLSLTQCNSEFRKIMVRALTEPWGRPSALEKVGIDLVKSNPELLCIARAVEAWPLRLSARELFGSNSPSLAVDDQLLCALLYSAPICDIEMERFLTVARSALLEVTLGATSSENDDGAALSFYSGLARQCFINEYVFSYTDVEIQKAEYLRELLAEALESKTRVPILWIVTVAAYFPLGSLSLASVLLNSQWPEEVTDILVQQIREPLEELQLRATISRLTDVQGEVTLLVQDQYEQNPYPRWIKAEPVENAMNINVYLSRLFPMTSFKHYGESCSIDVLIAGCGTGQHPIESAQKFSGAKVLAVDLSINSLCYAKRKTLELGLTSIEYAQADLMKLNSLGRSFDIIESIGVLHHLANPWAGWQVLLSLLRPGGFMKIGLYSELARRDIVRIRTIIAEQGYGSTADEIRRFRQDLMALDNDADFESLLKCSDFFSTSNCRDLLFHVQEHRMTLTGIETFLLENNLEFMGFEVERYVINAYRKRFPEDLAASNLGNWQLFENENPYTFAGMYQFWIQKTG